MNRRKFLKILTAFGIVPTLNWTLFKSIRPSVGAICIVDRGFSSYGNSSDIIEFRMMENKKWRRIYWTGCSSGKSQWWSLFSGKRTQYAKWPIDIEHFIGLDGWPSVGTTLCIETLTPTYILKTPYEYLERIK